MFDNFFNNLSHTLHLPQDQVRYLMCIILTYPFAYIFRQLPSTSPNLKHVYSICVTLLLFIFIHDQLIGLIHLLSSCLITYMILYFNRTELAPKLVFIWVMSHMSCVHLLRMYFAFGVAKMDFSGPMMVWTMKLSMLGYNVYDGRKDPAALSTYQKSKRVVQLPSPLEFLGYVFYFAGFFVGPAFAFQDYLGFVKLERFQGKDRAKGLLEVAGSKLAAMQRLGVALGCGVFPIFIAPYFHPNLYLTSSFLTYPLPTKIFSVIPIFVCERFKYYFVWKLAEGACVLSNFGYNGLDKDDRPLWDGLSNVNILKVELGENFKMLFENWNIGANVWLKQYVYLRLVKAGCKPTGTDQLLTFLTSAVWHGFYPGYYLTFVYASLANELARLVRRKVRPHLLGMDSPFLKRGYDLVGTLVTSLAINYAIIPFIFLTPALTWKVYSRIYFFGHIGLLFGFLFFKFHLDKLVFPKLTPELKRTLSDSQPNPTSLNPISFKEVPVANLNLTHREVFKKDK